MATILASQSGNFGDASTWATGTVPVAGDVVVANGRTITINVNVTCAELRNDTTGGATLGGGFTLIDSITLTANLYLANPVSNGQFNLLTYPSTSGRQAYIVGNVYGNTGGTGYGCHAILHSGTGSLYITGNIAGGNAQGSSTPTAGINNSANGTVVVNGNVSGGTGVVASYGVYNALNGTIIINGNIAGGVGGATAYNAAAGQIVVNGNVAASGSVGVANASTGAVIINGNVAASTANGCANSSAGSIYIYGNATADSGVGALNSGAGIISISGSATGSAANYGASNTSVGTLIVKRAVGGPGSAAVAGVNSSLASSLTYVQEIEYGDLGQSPTTGPIILTDQSTNVAVFYRFGSSKKTLIDSSSISNTVPVAGDVRAGVVYNNGNLTGTCQIPSAGSVAYGVAVDATTGTAVLNQSSIFDYLTSNTFASGSIGERIKNAATVSTMGQQITSSLS